MASLASCFSPPWMCNLRTTTASSSKSSSSFRVSCSGELRFNSSSPADLKFVLHDALNASGYCTSHAREAREGFCSQIEKMSSIERQTSICFGGGIDMGKTALYIAAEDDSLVSHSSVPLPVDTFLGMLDDLSMGYCSNYSTSLRSSPEAFLESLERYLYDVKGFRRTNLRNQLEPRTLYLHSVLTHRSGSAVMLSLIYAKVLKMLRLCGILDFDVEIYFPHDPNSLPKAYHKQKSKESDQLHIMTSQTLLVEMLRSLKDAFWPFHPDRTRSLFLRAADAANCTNRLNTVEESCWKLASAKASQHRPEHGMWTGVRVGDMKRALSACERLILLKADPRELRDYSILLYHCGFYEQSLQYLKHYHETKKEASDSVSVMEEDAEEKLMVRLSLISMEKEWSKESYVRSFFSNNSEPW